MNAVTESMPEPLGFTNAAAAKVKSLIDEEGNPNLKLRVFVQGGGCSGFQYGFTFDEDAGDDDTRLAALLPDLRVATTAPLGVEPEHVEALAFAWLARQEVKRKPGNLPAVTGARGPRVLGAMYPR